MRDLIVAIKNDNDREMSDLIRAMMRLWPKTLGLRRRREAEAALVELADEPVDETDILKVVI